MIIPSIDLMDGNAVQLVGGRDKALDAGDPLPIAERFALAGEIAVVDLDAALSRGSNREVMASLVRQYRCRVGGGIRSAVDALDWLDAGATQVVLGTAARPEVLGELPAERVVAALDAVNGEVVVEGWRKKTGEGVLERMRALQGLVGGFLITSVEREGQMVGVDFEAVKRMVEAAGDARVTIAGGVRNAEDVARIDQQGADAQVGMALYTGAMHLADSIAAVLTSDRLDDLWATLVCDESDRVLGLAWSSPESLRQAIETRRGVYCSRQRGLWVKGESSGNTQVLLGVQPDCDRDAIKFTVRQQGAGFCHKNTRTCFGPGAPLNTLEQTLGERLRSGAPGSYTARLSNNPALLHQKLLEEAEELSEATTPAEVCHEAADLLYFAMVKMATAGVSLADVEAELSRRALRIRRRPGEANRRRRGHPSIH